MKSIDPEVLIAVPVMLGVLLLLVFALSTETFRKTLDFFPGAMVVFILLLALPFPLYYAWQQAGAEGRLRAAGLPVWPGFAHATGAQGGREPRAVWRFAVGEESGGAEAATSFYRSEATRTGLSFSEISAGAFELKNEAGVRHRFTPERDGEGGMVWVIERLRGAK
jgi:hypothetical protein